MTKILIKKTKKTNNTNTAFLAIYQQTQTPTGRLRLLPTQVRAGSGTGTDRPGLAPTGSSRRRRMLA
jgi:hypothetical protein